MHIAAKKLILVRLHRGDIWPVVVNEICEFAHFITHDAVVSATSPHRISRPTMLAVDWLIGE